MSIDSDITIDLLAEGPCFESLELPVVVDQLRQLYSYKKNITVLTANMRQSDQVGYRFDLLPPMHFVHNTKNYLSTVDISKDITKKIGMFISRSNAPRLDLASHVWKTHKEHSVLTYHFDIELPYHRDNIGLDDTVKWQHSLELHGALELLDACPLKFTDVEYPILMDQHCDIHHVYRDFLIEIVCETYYSGNTFFPTEKIWRPIVMGTPFIVQGPKFFLHALRDLGFETFHPWWDEGYAEDPADWQTKEIKQLIDRIASTNEDTVKTWYNEMAPVLDHNRSRFLALTESDWKSVQNKLPV